ncbi:MAG: hypothetical protein D4R84_15180 [Rhodocyclaceae bacterium]|nr:MAG: hypothetical protein D4R84_15180 [Rhodocyclaceae bacterium]
MTFRYFCVGLIVLGCSQVWADEVALVMSVQGKVVRLADAVTMPVEAFVKLKEGDKLSLEKDSRLQVVYFENGRQETWSGPGRLEMTLREGKASGLPAAEVKSLPMVMARQLARTPALDGQGRGGVTRLRSVPGLDAMVRLEDTYHDLRSRAGPNDLGPEMYLLSGLYDMRELDRVERVLGDLQQDRPKNPEAALLIALYKKAVKNARESKK